jgi:hypothetical protein
VLAIVGNVSVAKAIANGITAWFKTKQKHAG